MSSDRQWTLGGKLALVAAPFALLALGAIAALVWMAWQLDGGAAAVNEAGRMRMQAYRLVLSAGGGQTAELNGGIDAFERSLRLLREGDPDRPLFVPWDAGTRTSFAGIEQDWSRFRLRLGTFNLLVPIGDLFTLIANHLVFLANLSPESLHRRL